MQAARRSLIFAAAAAVSICASGAGAAHAQTTASPAPSAAASAPQPPPSSSNAIESTILSYQSLAGGAEAIAQAIQPQLPTPSKIIVATPADVTAILQLRIVRAETAALQSRLGTLTTALPSFCKGPRVPERLFAPMAIASLIGSLASTLATVAQLTASTEITSSTSINITDPTLTNLVAETLASVPGVSVYVPNLAVPNLYNVADPDVKQSYLYGDLQQLDNQREALEKAAQDDLTASCRATENGKAALKLAVAAIAATDKFEAALYGGGIELPSTALVTGLPSPAPSSAGGSPPKAPGIQNSVTINNQPQSAKSSAPAGPSVMQRLLYVDLLLHDLAAGSQADPQFPRQTYLLSVHALDAGGTQLSKTVFLSTRQYYSGGAVATFALVNSAGAITCSGLAYGYRGFVAASDFSSAIQSASEKNPKAAPGTANLLPSTLTYQTGCPVNKQL